MANKDLVDKERLEEVKESFTISYILSKDWFPELTKLAEQSFLLASLFLLTTTFTFYRRQSYPNQENSELCKLLP